MVQLKRTISLLHFIVSLVRGLKVTGKKCLTSDPFRQEVSDTGLAAWHCVSPQMEIPVFKCEQCAPSMYSGLRLFVSCLLLRKVECVSGWGLLAEYLCGMECFLRLHADICVIYHYFCQCLCFTYPGTRVSNQPRL